jgi:hypothetical protein
MQMPRMEDLACKLHAVAGISNIDDMKTCYPIQLQRIILFDIKLLGIDVLLSLLISAIKLV